MRGLFCAGNNQLQYGYDYSSLEARIEGSYVYDYEGGPELAEALLAEKPNDIHSNTAVKLNISRDNAKSINYALLYGAAAPKIGKLLSIPLNEAEAMYNAYWDALPSLKALKEDAEQFWEQTGNKFIKAFDGRYLSTRSKHSILNVLLQSGGSLAMKYGIIFTAQRLENNGFLGNIINDNREESENKINQMIIYHKQIC